LTSRWWRREAAIFIDFLDGDGRLLARLNSQVVTLAQFRALLDEVHQRHPDVVVEPEVEALLSCAKWPQPRLQRYASFGVAGVVLLMLLSGLLQSALFRR